MCPCNIFRRRPLGRLFLLLLAAGLILAVRAVPGLAGGRPVLVVSTTMLESLVRDAGDGRFEILTLMPPSACPGHFDLKPSDRMTIRRADLILFHPFQRDLEQALKPHIGQNVKWLVVEEKAPLTIPEAYRETGRRLVAQLEALYPEAGPRLRTAWKESEGKILRLERHYRKAFSSGGKSLPPVLAAYRQKDFVASWGFPVAGVFDTPEGQSLREFSDLVRRAREQGVAAVIGNLQNGDRDARALAEKLGVPLVMLNNFPGAEPGTFPYAALLESNCKRLLAVTR
jgi:zinc transport system substrate-binding protein